MSVCMGAIKIHEDELLLVSDIVFYHETSIDQPLKVLCDKKGRCSEKEFQLEPAEYDKLSASVQCLPSSTSLIKQNVSLSISRND